MKRKHIIVYTFESLEDPLIKGLILHYLREIQKETSSYIFHLFTHEHTAYKLNAASAKKKKEELFSEHIHWYPINYFSGSFKLIKKIINFLHTFCIALKIKLRYKPSAVIGFLAVAGGFSYILSRLLNLKLIIYCFEPHSEYMADFRIWKRNGLKHRLLRRFELLQVKKSDHLVIPNQHTKKLIEQFRTKNNVTVCPISIDTDVMVFDRVARERIRSQIKAADKTILIYTGKFGGIYFSSDEIIEFFLKLRQANDQLFFYIITPNTEETKMSIAKFNLPGDAYHLSSTVSYHELNQHLSAADIGFVGLPALASQKYRTPVKTAMYLSCQLPYMVTKDVGVDDLVAVDEKVGIVIKDLQEDPSMVADKINNLLTSDPTVLKACCRSLAENTRSTRVAVDVFKKILGAY